MAKEMAPSKKEIKNMYATTPIRVFRNQGHGFTRFELT